ncbi:MAG: trigger factor [Spirochaetales bacterium]|nr:trigger factor [Spirochaetales bacterium]
MVKDKKIDRQEHSSVKLSVTIDKKEGKKQYSDLIGKYTKTAQIKGFRKGKAPAEVLERKFGEAIRQEAMMTLLESGLKEVFEQIDEKPLPYSRPVLQDEEALQFDTEKDFAFSVVYDIFPDVKLGPYKELKIEVPSCTISDKDLTRELEGIQERNAIVREKADSTVAKDCIVTVNYVELDDKDAEAGGTKREDFVFTVGTGQNLYGFDDDLIGMKKDEEKIITKKFGDKEKNPDLAGRTVKLKVKVTAVKTKELPKLDDELAQDVSEKYKTLEDLKKDLKDDLEKQLDSMVRQKKIDALMDQIVASSEIDPPESMIKAELENSWRNFLMQSRMQEESLLQILQAQGKSRDDLMGEWRESAVKNVKSQLILGKLAEEEKIDVSDEDVQNEIKKQAALGGQKEEDVRAYFEQGQMMEYLKSDLLNRKVFDMLIGSAKTAKGKKVDFVDLMNKND